ncbi:CDP-diacylglycerol-glycerol-3-phosphate 3-phosphatidyltransferase [Lipomyces oligophaga]|uniref:CDP-diacylglycerol-glycerol-3-phosphate 3-phosphatidyltransferase n=1 Tax=Lipomyces oligophaga TaxID=45792 RepID=UPI0034CE35E2
MSITFRCTAVRARISEGRFLNVWKRQIPRREMKFGCIFFSAGGLICRMQSTGQTKDGKPEEKLQEKFRDALSRDSRKKLYKDTKVRTQDAMKRAYEKIPRKMKPVFHENVYTVPNLLTMSRLVATPFIGYLIVTGQESLAVMVFSYACVTDWLDGFIARRYNLQSIVGSVIDPMADKFLMVTLTGTLAWIGSLPVWLATIILGRDILLGVAAIYYRYISLPPPKTFSRYWDFSIPSAEVHPTTISKYNTVLQMSLVGLTVLKPVMLAQMSESMQLLLMQGMAGLEYTVAATTLISGLSYVFSKTAVKILTEEEVEQRRLEQENRASKGSSE